MLSPWRFCTQLHKLFPFPLRCDRRKLLAPQIKMLRETRTEFKELEQTYIEHKEKYEASAAGLEADVSVFMDAILESIPPLTVYRASLPSCQPGAGGQAPTRLRQGAGNLRRPRD